MATGGKEKKTPGKKVVQFNRDAQYYFNKGTLYFQRNKLDKALVYFRKAVEIDPGNPLNFYNLGCLLSQLGQLKEANNVFKYLIEELDPQFTECYFLQAINCGLLEDLEKTEKFLRLYLKSNPEGEMAEEARELLFALTDEEPSGESPESRADLEDNVYRNIIRTASQDEMKEIYESNMEFRKTTEGGIYYWDDDIKEKIISLYEYIACEHGERVLRGFVKNPWVKERLRQLALLALKGMGVKEQLMVYRDGTFQEINTEIFNPEAPLWKKEWQGVLECATNRMSASREYEPSFFEDIQTIWMDFINTIYPEVPRIAKIETWAAGLEYSLTRFHFLGVSQQKTAMNYGVSASSVAAKYKEINKVLNLEKRAYQNIVNYLQSLDKKVREKP